jgi:excisionase family DNA binding protein
VSRKCSGSGDTADTSGGEIPLLGHPDYWTVMLTVEEVAERIKASRAKTFDLIADGSIRSRKIGRLRRVLLGDLATFIASLEVDGGDGVIGCGDTGVEGPEGAEAG